MQDSASGGVQATESPYDIDLPHSAVHWVGIGPSFERTTGVAEPAFGSTNDAAVPNATDRCGGTTPPAWWAADHRGRGRHGLRGCRASAVRPRLGATTGRESERRPSSPRFPDNKKRANTWTGEGRFLAPVIFLARLLLQPVGKLPAVLRLAQPAIFLQFLGHVFEHVLCKRTAAHTSASRQGP